MKRMVLLLLMVLGCDCVHAVDLPRGTTFIGLKPDGHWQAYVVGESQVSAIEALSNIQEFTYSKSLNRHFYIGANEKLYEYRLDKKAANQILAGEKDRITQITALQLAPNRDGFYGVLLQGGRSKSTRLVFYNALTGKVEPLVDSRISAFEPQVQSGRIVFAGLVCVEACGGPVQEIWLKDLDIDNARQMTLLHGFVKQPFWDGRSRQIYFSYPKQRQAGIWKMGEDGLDLVQVTQGDHWDTSPQTAPDGSLYFLRQQGGEAAIYCLKDGVENPVVIAGISSVRDLEIGRE